MAYQYRFRETLQHVHRREKLSDEQRQLLESIDGQLGAEVPIVSDRQCPECNRPFGIVTVRGVEIDCCRFCRSIWFDPGELQGLSRQSRDVPSGPYQHRGSRYRCPVCREEMTEHVFLNPFNLLVDQCPRGHGVYLEDRELERVFEIV